MSGLLAAALALAAGQAFAAVVGLVSSPILAVGGATIDSTPEFMKSFAIATFGSNDKVALIGGMATILAIAAIAIGLLAVRAIWLGWIGIALFALIGSGAVLSRPTAQPIDVIPTLLGSIAGVIALTGLIRAARFRPVPAERTALSAEATESTFRARRQFLIATTVVGGLTVMAGGIGLAGLARPSSPTAGLKLPVPADVGAAAPSGASAAVSGVSPFLTPNARFYRVDTAIIPPVVDPATWRLRIHGMVDHELSLDLPTLLARPSIERDLTLTCVSNPVGGPYAGNARWIGIPLKALLEEAGVQAGADQIVSRSVDGFTVGTPTAIAMDGRDAMLAVGMNGQPLPIEHGFPVRMLVPGLYGYVSATKWLTDIELTTFAAYDSYWVQRGWDAKAPVETMARIDTPAGLSTVPAGNVAIGGVAWALHRGIDKVEVQVDEGPFVPATLAAVDTLDTWRQWSYAWAATTGRHSITVRATDGMGMTQTESRADPFPNAATGWHSLVVNVS